MLHTSCDLNSGAVLFRRAGPNVLSLQHRDGKCVGLGSAGVLVLKDCSSALPFQQLFDTGRHQWYFLASGSGAPIRCGQGSSDRLQCASDDGVSCKWGTYGSFAPFVAMFGVAASKPLEVACPAWPTDDGTDACERLLCYASATAAPQSGSCPQGYSLQEGNLANYGDCPNTAEAGSCVLPAKDAAIFCNAKADCSGFAESANQSHATYGSVQVGTGPVLTNPAWKSCVKAITSPQAGLCPSGYTLQHGGLDSYGPCPNSTEASSCILPPAEAAVFCSEQPNCSGFAETSNRAWLTTHAGRVQLGTGPGLPNAEWTACIRQ